MTSDTQRAALSPEAWKAIGTKSPSLHLMSGDTVAAGTGDLPVIVRLPEGRHALAALCLYQQEFGFSAEDVKNLETIGETGATVYDWTLWARDLASRIASLLPPDSENAASREEG